VDRVNQIDRLQIKRTDSLYAICKTLFGERKFKEAVPYYDTVIPQFLSQQRFDKYFMSKRNQSLNQRAMYVPDEEALAELKSGLLQVNNAPLNTFALYAFYLEFSDIYSRLGNYLDARYYAELALSVLNDPVNQSNSKRKVALHECYDYLAIIENNLYNYDQSEKYRLQQLEIAENDQKKIRTLVELVDLYSASKAYDKASVLLDTVSWESRLEGMSFYEKYVYQLTKLDYFIDVGRNEEAITAAIATKDLIGNSGYGAHFSSWYLDQRLYELYFKQSKYEKVVEIINSIDIEDKKEEVRKELRARDFYWLSRAYFYSGNTKAAIEHLSTSINYHLQERRSSEEFLSPISLDNVLFKSSLINKLLFKTEICMKLYEKSSEEKYFSAALQNYGYAHELLKLLGHESSEDRFLEDEQFKKLYENYLNGLHKAYNETQDDDIFYKAFSICDEAKNLAVLNELAQLKESRIFKNIPIELREKKETIDRSLDSLLVILRDRGRTERTVELIDSLEIEKIHYIEGLKNEYPNYHRLLYGTSETIHQILNKKLKDFNIIEYFIGNDAIFIFNKNLDQRSFDKILLTPDLELALSSLSKSLRQPGNTSYITDGKLVFDRLFRKYFRPSTKTVLVLDGQLHNIPFEAFSDEENYVISKTSFLRINSVTNYSESINTRKTAAIAFAPFASLSSKDGEILKGSSAEAKFVKDAFGGKLRIDLEASKSAFLNGSYGYPIIHLATHSSLNSEEPLQSAIYFAREEGAKPSDYMLQLEELYSLDVDADLVTLSSCETGLGKEVKGRGVQSISNAFKYAGVSSTVMSLWKVPDKETSLIMMAFYKNLKEGMPKDEALSRSKLEYLENTSDADLRHPYYWAGFVISGDSTPLKVISMNTKWQWWLGGLFLLGFAGIGLYKRSRSA
jgi:hypothetical protein